MQFQLRGVVMGAPFFCLCTAIASQVYAATFTITSATDDGSGVAPGTLSWAINQANATAGNTIAIDPSVTKITVTGTLPAITRSITLSTSAPLSFDGVSFTGSGTLTIGSGSLSGANGAPGPNFSDWYLPDPGEGKTAIAGSSFSIINHGAITGGAGGRGSNNVAYPGQWYLGAHGSYGGVGKDAVNGTGFTFVNNGTLIGGRGGDGGYASSGVSMPGEGGGAGNGGAGVRGSDFTLVNNGTITGGAGGLGGAGGSLPYAGASGVDGVDGVGVVSTGGSTIRNAGTIAGAGDANAIELSGGGNTLVLESGWVFTGDVVSTSGSTAGGDTLALGGSSDATFDQSRIGTVFDGFLNFSKLGSATWTLGGTGTEDWIVEEGLLVVNGTAGAIDVLSGGRLGGTGTVGATFIRSDATLAPGNSIGTLLVDGDLTFEDGSTFSVELANDGSGDLVDVAGVAHLGNATVRVGALDSTVSYRDGETYTILTAQDGINGAFDPDVLLDSAFLAADLIYATANRVDLSLSVSDFESLARTPNQRAVSLALDGMTPSGPLLALRNKLLMLGTGEVAGAYDQLSGGVHAAGASHLAQGGNLLFSTVNDRMRSTSGGVAAPNAPVTGYAGESTASRNANEAMDAVMTTPADDGRLAAWGQAFGGWVRTDGDGNASGMRSHSGGFMGGVDAVLFDNWRFGIAAGYSASAFSSQDVSSDGESDDYHLGIYSAGQVGNLGFRSGLFYTWHDISTARDVTFGGFTDHLTANYDAGRFMAFGEVSYGVETEVARFEPFAGLSYVNLRTDSFSETGGAAALTVSGATTETVFTTIGLRSATRVQFDETPATLRGTVGWQHAFGDTSPTTTSAFASGASFETTGTPLDKDSVIVEAGIDLHLTPRTVLGATYQGQFAPGNALNRVRAELQVRF